MQTPSVRFMLPLLAMVILESPVLGQEPPPPAPMAEPAAEMAPAPALAEPVTPEPAPAATPVPIPAPPALAEPVTPEPAPAAAPVPIPAPPALAEPVAPEPAPASPSSPSAAPLAPSEAPVAETVETLEAVEEVKPEDLRWDLGQIVQSDRAVNVQWAQTVRRRAFLLIVDHRTFQAAFNKNSWNDFFGLDGSNLRVGIGLRYGILDGLDAGIYRLSNAADAYDTYEFDAKWRFLKAEKHYVDLAIRGGLSWFSQKNAKDAVGGFGQVLVSRMLFKRLTVGAGLAFHSDSSSAVKTDRDTQWSLAIPGAVEIRILPWLAWNVEASFRVAGYGAKWPSFSTAWKFYSPRHVFSLMLSNTQYIGADGLVANSHRGYKEFIIGFQIQREFQL